MIISGHQPVYLPGIIVMAKMALVDQWCWVGHCDYQHRSWQSHNFIRGFGNPLKLIVPVRKSYSGNSINETLVLSAKEDGWRTKHLNSIKHIYGKRPHFDEYYPELEAALLMPCEKLGELNIGLANLLCHWLDIQTPTHKSEDYKIGNYPGNGTLMLAEMCEKLEAKHYLSSPGEAAYVKPELMNGFAHSYIKFTHPEYEQGYRSFMPNLSVIDLVFNCGPQSGDIVRSAATI